MGATINISTELEEKLAGRAAAQGKGFEQFALEALERAADTPTIREAFADVREQIEALGISEEELDTKIEAAVDEVRIKHCG